MTSAVAGVSLLWTTLVSVGLDFPAALTSIHGLASSRCASAHSRRFSSPRRRPVKTAIAYRRRLGRSTGRGAPRSFALHGKYAPEGDHGEDETAPQRAAHAVCASERLHLGNAPAASISRISAPPKGRGSSGEDRADRARERVTPVGFHAAHKATSATTAGGKHRKSMKLLRAWPAGAWNRGSAYRWWSDGSRFTLACRRAF